MLPTILLRNVVLMATFFAMVRDYYRILVMAVPIYVAKFPTWQSLEHFLGSAGFGKGIDTACKSYYSAASIEAGENR